LQQVEISTLNTLTCTLYIAYLSSCKSDNFLFIKPKHGNITVKTTEGKTAVVEKQYTHDVNNCNWPIQKDVGTKVLCCD